MRRGILHFYITLVRGVAGTSFLQGFQARLISVRLPYRVLVRICSFDIRLHIFFMFGDFFGYVGAVNASMLLPMIVAKLSSGIVAMVVSLWLSKGR